MFLNTLISTIYAFKKVIENIANRNYSIYKIKNEELKIKKIKSENVKIKKTDII